MQVIFMLFDMLLIVFALFQATTDGNNNDYVYFGSYGFLGYYSFHGHELVEKKML
jgi:hypothetical protein